MKKIRILCIDDDIPLTRSLRLNLEDTGNFEVHIENDSLHAIATAREFKPDIILLDIVMPGLDGGDVRAQLMADPYLRKIPVIMVTALVSNGETGDSPTVNNGGEIMMAKPIRFQKLLQAIESQLIQTV